jgi:hypothetical protein
VSVVVTSVVAVRVDDEADGAASDVVASWASEFVDEGAVLVSADRSMAEWNVACRMMDGASDRDTALEGILFY